MFISKRRLRKAIMAKKEQYVDFRNYYLEQRNMARDNNCKELYNYCDIVAKDYASKIGVLTDLQSELKL